jgi:hypothetical protein
VSTRLRLGFVIERKNYYRVLGPVVDAALRRGFAVECWHDHAQPRWGTKASEFPDWTPTFRFGVPEMTSFQGRADLQARLEARAPDAIVALAPPPGPARCRWIGVQYMTNLVNPFGAEGVRACDRVLGYSPFWLDHAVDYLGAAGALGAGDAADMAEKFAPVGVPEMDQVEAIDPAEVRRRLGLPKDRPVVVYLPYPIKSNPPTFWLRHVYGPSSRVRRAVAVAATGRRRYWPHVARDWTDRRLVETVRRFCDRNGAALVVKSRLKDPVPRHTARLADRVLYDPSHYPATILELLSVASLCVHFFSSAAYEAVFMGVPSLCLAPDADDMGLSPLWTRELFHVREGGSYHFPGASYHMALPEAYDRLGACAIADFRIDPAARARYVRTFMGFDDTKSAERALDLVEAAVNRA